ncbi:hypothetical protein V8C40DRAFT_251230 [Trichoderma camerunense]
MPSPTLPIFYFLQRVDLLLWSLSSCSRGRPTRSIRQYSIALLLVLHTSQVPRHLQESPYEKATSVISTNTKPHTLLPFHHGMLINRYDFRGLEDPTSRQCQTPNATQRNATQRYASLTDCAPLPFNMHSILGRSPDGSRSRRRIGCFGLVRVLADF